MSPNQLNVFISAVTNYLYCKLSDEEFKCLSIIINELSKAMFAMSLYEGVCGKTTPEATKKDGAETVQAEKLKSLL